MTTIEDIRGIKFRLADFFLKEDLEEFESAIIDNKLNPLELWSNLYQEVREDCMVYQDSDPQIQDYIKKYTHIS